MVLTLVRGRRPRENLLWVVFFTRPWREGGFASFNCEVTSSNLRRKLNHLAALLGRIPESPLSKPVWHIELDYFCNDRYHSHPHSHRIRPPSLTFLRTRRHTAPHPHQVFSFYPPTWQSALVAIPVKAISVRSQQPPCSVFGKIGERFRRICDWK
jgi:hypothetical protein